MPPSAPQQYLNVNISGIKAPLVRKDVPDQEDIIEEHGEEAKYFVESKLLQKDVNVILEELSGNNIFFASILHPAGNIAEYLVAAGLAKVADRSIVFVTNGPTRLRAAEKYDIFICYFFFLLNFFNTFSFLKNYSFAKEKRLKLWSNFVAKSKAGGEDHEFEGTVGIIEKIL